MYGEKAAEAKALEEDWKEACRRAKNLWPGNRRSVTSRASRDPGRHSQNSNEAGEPYPARSSQGV